MSVSGASAGAGGGREAAIGVIGPWRPGIDCRSYLARMDMYLLCNMVATTLKVPTFLTLIGEEAFELLQDLMHPNDPTKETYDDLKDVLIAHLAPEPSQASERYKFQCCKQKPGQTISDFIVELQKAASKCKFNDTPKIDYRKDRMCDQLIFGLSDDRFRAKLLTDKSLDYDNAVTYLRNAEAASADSKTIGSKDIMVSKVQGSPKHASYMNKASRQHAQHNSRTGNQNQKSDRPCYRCGSHCHTPEDCKFLKATCFYCKKPGHISKVCQKRLKTQSSRQVKFVKDLQPLQKESSDYWIKNVRRNGEDGAIFLSCSIDGKSIAMELDTGCSMSLIPRSTYDEFFSHIPLQPCQKSLHTYTNDGIEVIGEITVTVEHNKQSKVLPLIVVSSGQGSLFGRNWFRSIVLDWNKIGMLFDNPCSAKFVTDVGLNNILNRFSQLFDNSLGRFNGGKVHLHVKENATPKFLRARTLPFAIKDRVEVEIQRLVSDDILEPVDFSEWASPIVPILKKNKQVRICGDFKPTFNPVCNVQQYPLPRVEELLSKFCQKQFFSKLDMSDAYLQLELDEESKQYVTINTTAGLFRYKRMPFGIACAPAIFQRTIDSVLKGIDGVQIYLDDIIVASSTADEHLRQLEKVFSTMQKYGLRLRESKCQFFQTSVEYLGYHIDREGIRPLDEKLKAIKEAPRPRNQSELRSYLGLLTFYARFLNNLSTVAAPLNKLLGKSPWQWSKTEEDAFENTKSLLLNSKLLIHYDPSKRLYLQCDASPYGIGIVLSHHIDNTDRPIAFASRSLTAAQRNWSQLEKEAFAIIFGLRKFREYIYGNRISIITDHLPLIGLFGSSKPFPERAAARIQRWALELSGYEYDIEYRRSTEHGNCDALSRLPLPQCHNDGEGEVHALLFHDVIDTAITSKRVRIETSRDRILSDVYSFISQGWPSQVNVELQSYFQHRNELTISQGCILWGRRVIIPCKLRSRILEELHESHMGIVRTKTLARSYVWWPNIDKDVEQMCNSCAVCQQQRNEKPRHHHPWSFPSSPWYRLHLDFAGPVDGKSYLVCVDAYSKWPEVIRMNNTTAETTVKVLRRLFTQHGLPSQVVSDNGRQFVSDSFKQFLASNGIRHITTPCYHPSSNGLAERFVQTFKKVLHCNPDNIDIGLSNFLLAYRNTAHATTGETPAQLLMGRSLRSRLDLVRPNIQDTVMSKNKQPICDSKTEYKVDDEILTRNYQGSKWLQGRIIKIEGFRNVIVDVGHAIWRRSIDQILPYSASRNGEKTASVMPPSSDIEQPPNSDIEPIESPRPISSGSSTPTSTAEEQSIPIPLPRRYPLRARHPPDRYPNSS